MICISCNHEHEEKFCPNCGEKAGTKKITFASIIEDAFSFITNMDRGFLFNLINLTTNPHQIVKLYLNGRRRAIFNPLTYFLLSITIYLVIESFGLTFNEVDTGSSSDSSTAYMTGKMAGKFIIKNLNIYWASALLWISIATRMLFSKYNMAEHLTINAFILGHATLAGIFSHIVYWLPIMADPFVYLVCLIMLYRIFKYDDEKPVILVKAFLSIIIFIILIIASVFAIGTALQEFNISV